MLNKPNFPIPVRYFSLDMSRETTFSNDFRLLPRPVGSFGYVAKGSAEYFCEDRTFRVEPGDMFFIPVGGTYISYWEPGPLMLALQFELPPTDSRRYFVQKLASKPGDREDFTEAVNCKEIDFELLERFYRICGRHWDELESVETRIDARIRPALERLELEVESPITVGELAALCHMSESHFYASFRASIGCAPMEYRKRLLIMKAQRLLSSRENSIGEVAALLGFESETYFRRVFKSEVGLSPRDFLKSGNYI